VFAADLQALRPHPGQAASAANLRALLAGSPIMASHRGPECTRVQDAYSLRCSPQVHGAARDTLAHADTVAGRELASAIDNPVVTPDGRVESNGNFHGAPVGYVLDFLAIAVADLGSMVRAERGLARMIRGLPGRKIVLTNAPSVYAHAVLNELGIARLFERVIAIEDMQHAGKCRMVRLDHVTHRACARGEQRDDEAGILISGALPDRVANLESRGRHVLDLRSVAEEIASRWATPAGGVKDCPIQTQTRSSFFGLAVLTIGLNTLAT